MTKRRITPPRGRFEATCDPPGSKSHTIRALFLAALADGESTIANGLRSDDTARARDCLRQLGVPIEDLGETWRINGIGGRFLTPDSPLRVGESGLTARILIAVSALVEGTTTISGKGRLPMRPMGEILEAVQSLGAVTGEGHPWTVTGQGHIPGGEVTVDGSKSSQVLSSILMVSPLAANPTRIELSGRRISTGYVDMTVEMMESFGADVETDSEAWFVPNSRYAGTDFVVPVDASAVVYPAAAAAISGGSVTIQGNPGGQPDAEFLEVLVQMGCVVDAGPSSVTVTGPKKLSAVDWDMSDAPDAAVTLAVLCAVADGSSRIEGLGSLRNKESDRLRALRLELAKVGATAFVEGDSLNVDPSPVIEPATLSSHGDHRLAMGLAILGLVGEGISIEDSEVVSKTWPDFWDWLGNTGVGVEQI